MRIMIQGCCMFLQLYGYIMGMYIFLQLVVFFGNYNCEIFFLMIECCIGGYVKKVYVIYCYLLFNLRNLFGKSVEE